KGLAAKPIIDLDLIIEDGLFEQVKSKLLAAGYLHEGDLGIAGREAFKYAEKPHLMKHHLYVCCESSPEWKRHIAFRDWLRTHDTDRDWYGKIKMESALLYPEDIDAYILYKTPCILTIYQKCGLV
ncbi:MAG TPA: GrpB family protein, partial [Bacillota bacterium]|nr:GrpB family protein [Bacillota bacterium]